jgi:hypothetical protein
MRADHVYFQVLTLFPVFNAILIYAFLHLSDIH